MIRNPHERGCRRCMRVVWGWASAYVFMYTVLYLVFGFLGVFRHPFYFAFHMSALFRISPELQNILKALWRPRKELCYTLIIFLVAEYIFAIFVYRYYHDEAMHNHCISLATCFLTVIDHTFKVRVLSNLE